MTAWAGSEIPGRGAAAEWTIFVNLIAITSGKGGTGKSCVAAFTSLAMSDAKKNTLLVEMGSNARSLDIITGCQGQAAFDLSDVLEGRCELGKTIAQVPGTPSLSLISAPLGGGYKPHAERMATLIRVLRREFDYILMDGVDFSIVSPQMFDTIIIVTTPDTLSVRACQEHARLLYEAGAANVRLVINDVPPQVIPIHGAQDFDDIIDMIGVQLIGVVPQSPKLHYSANNSEPIDEESITIQVFENLAARLRGQPRPLLIRY